MALFISLSQPILMEYYLQSGEVIQEDLGCLLLNSKRLSFETADQLAMFV